MSKAPVPINITMLEMRARPAHVRPQLPHSPDHVRAMLAFQSAGAVTFDYGNNIRAQAQGAAERGGHSARRSTLGVSGVWELFVPGIGNGTAYKYEILGKDGRWRQKARAVRRCHCGCSNASDQKHPNR